MGGSDILLVKALELSDFFFLQTNGACCAMVSESLVTVLRQNVFWAFARLVI